MPIISDDTHMDVNEPAHHEMKLGSETPAAVSYWARSRKGANRFATVSCFSLSPPHVPTHVAIELREVEAATDMWTWKSTRPNAANWAT